MPDFQKEIAVYNKNKERLLEEKHEGQFILIHKDEIIGIFPDVDTAYKAGLEKLGNVPMFIKKIQKDDPPATAPALMFGLLHAGIQ